MKSLPMDTISAISCVVHEAADRQLRQHSESLSALSGAYLRTKLELLEEKILLLQDVDALCEVERSRLAADKRELQVLRAQLALAQQSLLPIETIPGTIL